MFVEVYCVCGGFVCLFVEVLCVCGGFHSFESFCVCGGFYSFCVFVEVFIIFRGFVCLLRCWFCDISLSSTKRPGSILNDF